MSETENVEKKRILWVDDFPSNNRIEIIDFEYGDEISVTEVYNTQSALDKVTQPGSYDLIISDIGREECTFHSDVSAEQVYKEREEREDGDEIPDYTLEDCPSAGFQLLDELREEGDETPVIFYTSPFQVTRVQDRAGKQGVIKITASPEELYETVNEELGVKVKIAPALAEQLERLKRMENPQARGIEFEKFLKHMFSEEGLKPRGAFKLGGEQIDGSFEFNNRTFLIEAKWTSQPLSPADIYMFKGKVDGKMTGTIGVVISWSGYSKSVSDALTVGKELNVILITGNEIEAIVAGGISFRRLLEVKLRFLVETGDVLGDNAIPLITGEDKSLGYDIVPQLFVVCETQRDKHILKAFAERVIEEAFPNTNIEDPDHLSHIVRFAAAGGKMGIPKTVKGLQRYSPRRVIVVADTDGNEEATRDHIKRRAGDLLKKIILVDPQIENWMLQRDPGEEHLTMPGTEVEIQYREEEGSGMPTEKWLKDKVRKLPDPPDDFGFPEFQCEIEKAVKREKEFLK